MTRGTPIPNIIPGHRSRRSKKGAPRAGGGGGGINATWYCCWPPRVHREARPGCGKSPVASENESSDNRTQAEGDELSESVAAAKRRRRRAKSISQNRHDGVEIPIRHARRLSPSSFSSDGHELTDGPGDLFLRCRIEIGVHGQAEHLVREAFGGRTASRSHREVAIGGLPMQGRG